MVVVVSEKVSALDLVAVLAGGELLEVRLVLGRHEGVRHPARMREIISACMNVQSDTRHAHVGSSRSLIAYTNFRKKLHHRHCRESIPFNVSQTFHLVDI